MTIHYLVAQDPTPKEGVSYSEDGQAQYRFPDGTVMGIHPAPGTHRRIRELISAARQYAQDYGQDAQVISADNPGSMQIGFAILSRSTSRTLWHGTISTADFNASLEDYGETERQALRESLRTAAGHQRLAEAIQEAATPRLPP